jgi:hypothetical protein
MDRNKVREDLAMNTKTAKTFDEIDAEMRDTYFSSKVDMTPATIKTVSTCLDGKSETVVSRILEVDGKPFMGIDYAEGKPVGAWMTDARGRHVPIKMPEEQVEQKANKVLEKISSNLLKRVQKDVPVATKDTEEKVTRRQTTRTTQVAREREFS